MQEGKLGSLTERSSRDKRGNHEGRELETETITQQVMRRYIDKRYLEECRKREIKILKLERVSEYERENKE